MLSGHRNDQNSVYATAGVHFLQLQRKILLLLETRHHRHFKGNVLIGSCCLLTPACVVITGVVRRLCEIANAAAPIHRIRVPLPTIDSGCPPGEAGPQFSTGNILSKSLSWADTYKNGQSGVRSKGVEEQDFHFGFSTACPVPPHLFVSPNCTKKNWLHIKSNTKGMRTQSCFTQFWTVEISHQQPFRDHESATLLNLSAQPNLHRKLRRDHWGRQYI